MPTPDDGLAGPTPPEFLCPITRDLMVDPVCTADGQTYECAAISRWLETRRVSPVTNVRLTDLTLTPNRPLRSLIEAYLNQQPERERRAQDQQALIAKVDLLAKECEAAEGTTQSRNFVRAF